MELVSQQANEEAEKPLMVADVPKSDDGVVPHPYDYAELIAEIAPRPALLCLLQLLSLSLSRDAKRCSRVITMRSEILDQICPWFGRDLRPNFL